ncbi:MAG: hypothetical protein LQ352_006692 [Teloschistes flavicans]|nr:MAG: hypothetical protein LQ352_006692 [Teloschistes flavicans]
MDSQTPAESSSFPLASTFDILPPLHTLLTRLLAHQQQAVSAASSTSPATSPQTTSTTETPLSPKKLAAAAGDIRARISRARDAVKGLEDVDRNVGEQQEEIEELEREVQRLRGCVEKIKGGSP